MNVSDLIEKKNAKNDNLDFESHKDLIMYYQTSIRNVALTTAVSFAALAYSRFYRGKSKMYTSGMVLVSLLIIVASFILNFHLYTSIQKYKTLEKTKKIKNWEIVNILFFIAHIMIIFFGLYTFYRVSTGNTF
jgi:hypothetical protein